MKFHLQALGQLEPTAVCGRKHPELSVTEPAELLNRLTSNQCKKCAEHARLFHKEELQ